MRKYIQFSEKHPAILKSEITAVMPPNQQLIKNSVDKDEPTTRFEVLLRCGAYVEFNIKLDDITPMESWVERVAKNPQAYGCVSSNLAILRQARLECYDAIVDEFYLELLNSMQG